MSGGGEEIKLKTEKGLRYAHHFRYNINDYEMKEALQRMGVADAWVFFS